MSDQRRQWRQLVSDRLVPSESPNFVVIALELELELMSLVLYSAIIVWNREPELNTMVLQLNHPIPVKIVQCLHAKYPEKCAC